MKSLLVWTIIFAGIAAGCFIAELFVTGRYGEIWVTTGAICAVAAFIISLVAYVGKSTK